MITLYEQYCLSIYLCVLFVLLIHTVDNKFCFIWNIIMNELNLFFFLSLVSRQSNLKLWVILFVHWLQFLCKTQFCFVFVFILLLCNWFDWFVLSKIYKVTNERNREKGIDSERAHNSVKQENKIEKKWRKKRKKKKRLNEW